MNSKKASQQQFIWEHVVFGDLFCDSLIDSEDRETLAPAPPLHCLADTLQLLLKTCSDVTQHSVVKSNDTFRRALGVIIKTLNDVIEIGARLPFDTAGKDDERKASENFYRFLEFFVHKVTALNPGESLMFPGGWRTEVDAASYRVLLYSLVRKNRSFTFIVTNTLPNEEDGLTYHFSKAQLSPPEILKNVSFVLEDIPLFRLCDSSFWYFLFKQMLVPHPKNGAPFIYEVLLPYLNCRPLECNIPARTDSMSGIDSRAESSGVKPSKTAKKPIRETVQKSSSGQGSRMDGLFSSFSSKHTGTSREKASKARAQISSNVAQTRSGSRKDSDPFALFDDPVEKDPKNRTVLKSSKKPAIMKASAEPEDDFDLFSALSSTSPAPSKKSSKKPKPSKAVEVDLFAELDDVFGPSGDAGPQGDIMGGRTQRSNVPEQTRKWIPELRFKSSCKSGDVSSVNRVLDCLATMLHQLGMSVFLTDQIVFYLKYALLMEAKKSFSRYIALPNVDRVVFDELLVSIRHVAGEAAEALSLAQHSGGKTASIGFLSEQFYEGLAIHLKQFRKEVRRHSREQISDQSMEDISDLWSHLTTEKNLLKGIYFSNFGRFQRSFVDTSLFCSKTDAMQLFRPVEPSMLQQRVANLHDLCRLLREAVMLCTRIGYQADLIQNSYSLRLTLIVHLFVHVIPMPLPLTHQDRLSRCFYSTTSDRYETIQQTILYLKLISQQFAAVALSVTPTRRLDSMRMLVLGAIACLGDALLRTKASNFDSLLQKTYAGTLSGQSFGVVYRYFAIESSSFLLDSPALMLLRTNVLDYFNSVSDTVKPAYRLFAFEDDMLCGLGEELFIDQLCLELGCPRPLSAYKMQTTIVETMQTTDLPAKAKQPNFLLCGEYIAGVRREIASLYPEFANFRDIVFVLKLLMAPTMEMLPAQACYSAVDAELRWTVKPEKRSKSRSEKETKLLSYGGVSGVAEKLEDRPVKVQYIVSGFSTSELRCSWSEKTSKAKPWYSIYSRLRDYWSSAETEPRARPSFSDPATFLGSKAEVEDAVDVLNLPNSAFEKRLDDFSISRLTASKLETLGQYVTVPYLRIPLVLLFFSEPENTKLLMSNVLQQYLSSVLFEPGLFQQASDIRTDQRGSPFEKKAGEDIDIPNVEDKSHCETRHGYLYNELCYCPKPILEYVLKMLENVLQLDGGKFSESTSPCCLYVLQLCEKVFAFAEMVIDIENKDLQTVDALALKEKVAFYHKLKQDNLLPMLESWLSKLAHRNDLSLMSRLLFHCALLFYNHRWTVNQELDFKAARFILAAQVLFNSTTTSSLEPKPGMKSTKQSKKKTSKAAKKAVKEKRKPEAEIEAIFEFDLFHLYHRHRSCLIDYLNHSPKERSSIMNYIIFLLVGEETSSAQLRWERAAEDEDGSLGRFHPLGERTEMQETSNPGIESNVPSTDYFRAFEEIMRTKYAAKTSDTEVNVQLGELTLRKGKVNPLPSFITTHADFVELFENTESSFHSALVESSRNRRVYKILGLNVDVEVWNADYSFFDFHPQRQTKASSGTSSASTSASLTKSFTEVFKDKLEFNGKKVFERHGFCYFARKFPAELKPQEKWVLKSINALVSILEKRADVSIEYFLEKLSAVEDLESENAIVRILCKITSQNGGKFFKELVVFKTESLVHVYDVVESGRRIYSNFIYSTKSSHSYHQVSSKAMSEEEAFVESPLVHHLLRPVDRTVSIVLVKKNPRDGSKEYFVPARLLSGLIPDALLELYQFFQLEDGTLKGRAKETGHGKKQRVELSHRDLQLVPILDKSGETVWRNNPVLILCSDEAGGEHLALLDTQTLSVDSDPRLRDLVCLLSQLDAWSHILIWAKVSNNGVKQLKDGVQRAVKRQREVMFHSVEFPRLGLHFMYDESKEKLFSKEYENHFLSTENISDSLLQKLLQNIPNCLLLQNESDGSMIIALSATSKPVLQVSSSKSGFPRVLLQFDHSDEAWLMNCKHRCYIYEVHSSKMFLKSSTLSSTLYLIIIYLVGARFRDAFHLLDLCVSDVVIDAEEEQLFKLLNDILNKDKRVEAIALRLKLYLVAASTELESLLELDSVKDLEQYLSLLGHIDADLRLSDVEEVLILELLTEVESQEDQFVLRTCATLNRFNYINKLQAQYKADKATPFIVQVVCPEYPSYYAFDAVADDSILNLNDKLVKSLALMHYTKPEAEKMVSVSAIQSLNKWMTPESLRMGGGSESLGFLFLYELMTLSAALKILPNDSSYHFGCLMLRCLPMSETGSRDTMSSILRLLHYNEQLKDRLPTFQDTRKFKLSSILRGQNMIQKLIIEINQALRKEGRDIKTSLSKGLIRYDAPVVLDCLSPSNLFGENDPSHSDRYLVSRRGREYENAAFILETKDTEPEHQDFLVPFSSFPLAFSNEFVHSGEPEDRDVEESMPIKFPVSIRDEVATSFVARKLLTRLKDDFTYFTKFRNANSICTLRGVSSEPSTNSVEHLKQVVKNISQALRLRRAEDEKIAEKIRKQVIAKVNAKQWDASSEIASKAHFAYRLRLIHGCESKIMFEDVVRALLCFNPEQVLCIMNPVLSRERSKEVLVLTSVVMFCSVRIAQATKALDMCKHLLQLLVTTTTGPTDQHELFQNVSITATELAEQLSLRRHYITTETKMSKSGSNKLCLKFDPRLLVFEFSENLILRSDQIEMIEKFKYLKDTGYSKCYQMLMGRGKTTVLAPLLALILGTGGNLVFQVVPQELFHFSCSTMRVKFSSVLRKPVFTFKCDRYLDLTLELYKKMIKAKASNGVVISNPTSVKSFFLKFIEIVNAYQEVVHSEKQGKAYIESSMIRSLSHKLKNSFGRKVRKKLKHVFLTQSEASDREIQEMLKKELLRKAQLCVRILLLFKTGSLILDEVDLLLNPLKSELNWPLGQKVPLDLTEPVGIEFKLTKQKVLENDGEQERHRIGLRWKIPFFLLDALFFAETGKLTVTIERSRKAQSILQELRSLIKLGIAEKCFQRNPHLVLVDASFYHEKVKPLLASWFLVFLSVYKFRAVKTEDIRSYLLQGMALPLPIREQLNTALVDDQLKMLNLAHQWLHSFLPHVLQKVNRVHFGLLLSEEISALEEPNVHIPLTRRLLSVPFAGKDVPSVASEFSHPDVLIGLTVLGYRFSGLRYDDFVTVLTEIKTRLENQTGPYHKRTAYVEYASWMRVAGKLVRGHQLQSAEESKVAEEVEQSLLEFETDEEKDEDARRGTEIAVSSESVEVWPLQLVDLDDSEQLNYLFTVLGKIPKVIEYYLQEFVFPVTCQHKGLKLSTSGQLLGSCLLFRQRIGFSGTPSDLLPYDLGACAYERMSDGKMLHYLTSSAFVTHEVVEDSWSVDSILDRVAALKNSTTSYAALLDSGALITGKSNQQVAEYLLTKFSTDTEGIVFLDSNDRKKLFGKDNTILDLSQSGTSIYKRFVFYDQIHTTGTDIRLPSNAIGILTLGKDMTFRDYAQAAFRLRKFGQTQRIHVMIVPEVYKLISQGAVKQHDGSGNESGVLRDICSWLVQNSIRVEGLQFNLLQEQNVTTVARKYGLSRLLSRFSDGQSKIELKRLGLEKHIDVTPIVLQRCLEVFRDRVDYSITNEILRRVYDQRLKEMIIEVKRLVRDDKSIGELKEMVESMNQQKDEHDEMKQLLSYNREQTQEQEQEQEQQQEQEQEQQQETEPEKEYFLKKDYSKEKQVSPWKVGTLALPPDLKLQGFFPFSQFAPYGYMKLGKQYNQLAFPEQLLMSNNFYCRHWSTSVHKRLLRASVLLEWVPDGDQLSDGVELEKMIAVDEKLKAEARSKTGGATSKLLGIIGSTVYASRYSPLELSKGRVVELRKAFDVYANQYKTVDDERVVEVLRSLGFDVSSLQLKRVQNVIRTLKRCMSREETMHISFEEFRRLIRYRVFEDIEIGRFYVILSLAEAEVLRRLIHSRQDITGSQMVASIIPNSNACVALHLLQGGSLSMLDVSSNFVPRSCSVEAVTDSVRLFNSEHWFSNESITRLLNLLRNNSFKERKKWFLETRGCRRTSQNAIGTTSLVKLFTPADQHHLLHLKALIARIREKAIGRGWMVLDAFNNFDADKNGLVGCSEMYSALLFLGIHITPNLVRSFVSHYSAEKTGYLTYVDFKAALIYAELGDEDPLLQLKKEAEESQDVEVEVEISQRVIEELASEENLTKNITDKNAIKVLKDMKFKTVPHAGFKAVWSSRYLKSAPRILSVWKADTSLTWYTKMGRQKELFTLSHFATPSFTQPQQGSSRSALPPPRVLQVTDTGSSTLSGKKRHEAVVNRLLPHPNQFRIVWSKAEAEKPLYAWEPVSPDRNFVALGHVFTASTSPPDVKEVRVVHKNWLRPTRFTPRLVWKDIGTSGKSGSIWIINKLGHAVAVEGHRPPEGPFFEFQYEKFFGTSDFNTIKAQ